jgi:hypothetical protein
VCGAGRCRRDCLTHLAVAPGLIDRREQGP